LSKINKIKLGEELYEIEDLNVPGWAKSAKKPTYKTREVENDSGYLTEHQDISHLAKRTELHNHDNKSILDTITQNDIDKWNSNNSDGNVSSDIINSIVVVDSLPDVEEEGVLYLVKEIEEPAIEYVTNPTMQMGYLSTEDGTASESAEYCVPSDYIYIKGKPTLTVTNDASASMRVVCYDANKNFMTNWFTDDDGATYNYKRLASGGQYTFPDDAYYIKFRITSTEIVNVTIAYE
jgi:hypothetical protein